LKFKVKILDSFIYRCLWKDWLLGKKFSKLKMCQERIWRQTWLSMLGRLY